MSIAKTETVELNGEKHQLRLDFNALIRYEDATGRNALLEPIRFNLTDLRALTWACLVGDRPDLETVGQWLEDSDEDMATKVFELVANSFPDASPGTADPKPDASSKE